MPASGPSRIVVLAPNWLGDLVMALPAIASLRAWKPEAHLAVAARSSIAPVLPLVAGVDEVVPLDASGGLRSAITASADARRLAGGRFDAAVLLPNSFAAALVARRAGIAERWGFRRDFRGRLLTRAIDPPKASMHHAEYYLALVSALGAPALPPVASLRVRSAAAGSSDGAAHRCRLAWRADRGVCAGRRVRHCQALAAGPRGARWPRCWPASVEQCPSWWARPPTPKPHDMYTLFTHRPRAQARCRR